MSRKHNRRQKQLQQASKKILEIASRNRLFSQGKYNFVWTMQRNTDFTEQQLEHAWNQHFNSNKPTKSERLELQRQKDNRIVQARFGRKTRAPTAHNPGRHTARHGSAKNAKAVNKFRASLKPAPPKNKKRNGRPRR